MSQNSTAADLLEREQWSIELLARETDTAIARVQEMFLAEYAKLALNAHVKSFLSLLTANQVRCLLDAEKAEIAASARRNARLGLVSGPNTRRPARSQDTI
jgi:hypothetical protein